MLGNIRRRLHASRVTRHMTKGVQGKRQARIAFHRRVLSKLKVHVTFIVSLI
jgi:hypothetical protein